MAKKDSPKDSENRGNKELDVNHQGVWGFVAHTFGRLLGDNPDKLPDIEPKDYRKDSYAQRPNPEDHRGFGGFVTHVIGPFFGDYAHADRPYQNSTQVLASPGKLEKSVVIIGVISLLLGLFFLSSNITGLAISDITLKTGSMIGLLFFMIGILVIFLVFSRILLARITSR